MSGAVCTEVRFLFVGSEDAVLESWSDVAVGLTIPTNQSALKTMSQPYELTSSRVEA